MLGNFRHFAFFCKSTFQRQNQSAQRLGYRSGPPVGPGLGQFAKTSKLPPAKSCLADKYIFCVPTICFLEVKQAIESFYE